MRFATKGARPRRIVRLLWAIAIASVMMPAVAPADSDNYVEIARGKALATIGDCVACHTAPGGTPFAGGLALQTPFGAIMTPNITADNTTGIGSWSADDFARALHDGRRPGGTYLYPAFPYPYYSRVTRADTDAIYAYLHSLPAVVNRVNRNTLPFPFNIRLSMIGWNALFFTPGGFAPDSGRSGEFNRGAYLVEGLGHCGACHTPLNAFGANKADQYLQGNQIDHWTAPNITNDRQAGLGKWSVDDTVQYLKTGQTRTSIASGPMKDVVENSTSKMPDADLRAIAVYLKERGAEGPRPPAALLSSDARVRMGEAIFVDTCAACHKRSGEGVVHLFPRLAGNVIATQDDPASLIRIILTGGRGAATDATPTAPAMPSLGYRLGDEQVAAVVTYVRNSWGNAASPVSAEMVKALRERVSAARE
ncbi:cytochrome c [Bradyrhizobium sp.]|jgi:mono/diheme cytochrome c family protein|uniref:cytochrome c n=1 Tax=Bradyrhizobium sp. TaxID=376 RepID=UPI002CD13DFC|nr:cytochrome c [Bradyrhizobium sp.]HWX62526.1 cytochrome c [Bradyrhizobium sp.]